MDRKIQLSGERVYSKKNQEKNNKVYFQVGAGIVYDSIPEREYKETINKARAMVLAYENLKSN